MDCVSAEHAHIRVLDSAWGVGRVCLKPHMRYKDPGSTTKDADCECVEGFHFENEDQRACVPNRPCGKGYGQGSYGVCVKCIDQHMYSDTNDKTQKCKPLTNCEKQSRCTITKSNGTFDNICGPKVADVKSCDDPQPPASQASSDIRTYIIAGGVVGSILLIVFILLIIFIVRRYSYQRRKYAQKPLSPDQLEELKQKILKECERESALCKKVLSKSVFVVEERIERQIWTLAQEMYRSHPVQESQHKYAVNGYLQEWKSWRGENKEAVAELFRCLRQCKRDDIVYEICNGLRHDVGYEADLEAQLEEEGACNKAKHNLMDELMYAFCPCAQKKSGDEKPRPKTKIATPEKEKDKEAAAKLLDGTPPRDPDVTPHDAGAIYRSRASPSAPVIDDCNANNQGVVFVSGGGGAGAGPGVHRQYSQPVQATS
ncbi:hypothetical protein BaRGS_00010800 [Batillaria attramentaria]|uniref:receptor protein-tyrosine kinase n=1 Tax=Batillaria attramentaria TaxID=370345 RepID=A0ABD0LEQ7_9CAEN